MDVIFMMGMALLPMCFTNKTMYVHTYVHMQGWIQGNFRGEAPSITVILCQYCRVASECSIRLLYSITLVLYKRL